LVVVDLISFEFDKNGEEREKNRWWFKIKINSGSDGAELNKDLTKIKTHFC